MVDPRISEVRAELKEARKAYNAIADKRNLLILTLRDEGIETSELARLFAMREENILNVFEMKPQGHMIEDFVQRIKPKPEVVGIATLYGL